MNEIRDNNILPCICLNSRNFIYTTTWLTIEKFNEVYTTLWLTILLYNEVNNFSIFIPIILIRKFYPIICKIVYKELYW